MKIKTKSHTRTSSARPNTSSPGIAWSNSPSRPSTWRSSRASPSCPARGVALSRLDPYISRQPPNHWLKERERAIKKHFIILLYYLMYLRKKTHYIHRIDTRFLFNLLERLLVRANLLAFRFSHLFVGIFRRSRWTLRLS